MLRLERPYTAHPHTLYDEAHIELAYVLQKVNKDMAERADVRGESS
jgi:hypothetical protein